jgi:hypothetical protein
MEPRVVAFVTYLATLSLLTAQVAAAPPVRTSFEFDDTFPSDFLTAARGVPVYVHVRGAGTATLFYDKVGTHVVREFDILPKGLTTTIFSPVDQGGTGKSFTDVTQSPTTFNYPEGAEIGKPAIVTINGVQRTSGPGTPRIVGRQVYEGVVIGFTPDGVPIAEPLALISEAGQFDLTAVIEARCAKLTNP